MKEKESGDFPMRVQRFMSLAGVASRRECEKIIAEGRVSVNGKIITEAGCRVEATDRVCVGNRAIALTESRCYVMLNKPPGYTCTASDPHAEKKALDLIKMPGVRLFGAGRLDKDSEGMLIFSNDGDYVDKLTHPRYEILKTYVVRTDHPIPPEILDELRAGIRHEGEMLKPREIQKKTPNTYVFVLNEGKKREIRRMIEYAGRKTKSLERIGIGGLEMKHLLPGKWRFLSEEEVKLSLEANRKISVKNVRARPRQHFDA